MGNDLRPERAIYSAINRLSRLATIRLIDANDVDAELELIEAALKRIAARDARAAKALRCALAVWCNGRHPGGDGADGETYELCERAAKELEP